MAFRFLLNRGAARCAALLAGIAPLSAGSGSAQTTCDDPDVTVVATAPALDGYEILFRQNSVSFYSRLPVRDSAGPATVLIRNGNPYPVEVSYGVELQLQGETGARTLSLGRHCARIGPQGYAFSTEVAPPGAVAVRVRNLTIGNLADAPAPLPSPPVGSVVAEPPVGPGAAPAGQATGAAIPPDSAAAAPPQEAITGLDTLPAAPSRTSSQAPPGEAEASNAGPAGAVVRVVTRAFYLTAVAVLSLAGLALLPPVIATLYLLLLALVVLIRRPFRARSRDSGRTAGGSEQPDGR